MKKISGGIQECPHCGGDEFYVRATASGTTSVHYRFNGEEAFNGHMWDNVKLKEKKTAYCADCQKRIGTVED
ncbi:TPA: hypothetical protein ACPYV3_003821 [Citrobacter freundii]|uniref:Uncharacterized protein n=2 Tax=Citrobacter freundii complex TaxID=1344959 RepID=A0AAD1U1Q4_CITFR|nr:MULTISPECIES: hypothetical protein [Citrobacter]ELE2066227.1 hypothetical protein [Citrobacter freundii]MBA8132914.1 hypothetical protein [Citrobacter sp. RHBSTW-00013]MDN4370808.1 hypothetical protein [Citrobacter portucalensis]CAF2847961.1 hypothetical protein AI2935V1_5238 [Citrobacter freundii]CAH6622508.1 hypothetical protein AI2935V1_5238 [Citrobacter freundii]